MQTYPRFEDVLVFAGITPRTVNVQGQPKTVWDAIEHGGAGRKFQTWDVQMSQQVQNLLGQQVRVEYTERPSRDPQFPPNLQIESISLAAGGVMQPQQMPMQQPQQAAQPMQAQQPMQQPMQAAQPLPASQGTPGAGTGGGPSQDDKIHMRRSAAVKAAAYYGGAMGLDPTGLWELANQMMIWIETGNDPIPF